MLTDLAVGVPHDLNKITWLGVVLACFQRVVERLGRCEIQRLIFEATERRLGRSVFEAGDCHWVDTVEPVLITRGANRIAGDGANTVSRRYGPLMTGDDTSSGKPLASGLYVVPILGGPCDQLILSLRDAIQRPTVQRRDFIGNH